MLKKLKYFIYVALLFILFYLINNEILDISVIKNNHFNLITVNSIFAGFLFTSLGVIMSLYSNELLVKLERTSIMNDIYVDIFTGIVFSVISIIISVANSFISIDNITNNNLKYFFSNIMLVLELYFLLVAILQFIISVNDTRFIIKTVRLNLKKHFPSKENINKTLDKIK
ncbi:hypothetical protein SAMN05428976_11359 [Clostridium sp. USBA 49]|uniref:hypothetical protein n=1 Tax=Clostridium sp. USBA 49 TaxID=1881060 RepID=UPI00099A0136|nr:hypothetical protein [Clostridium sp. USBA 49]SKA89792.1 hypothetical protein SAMN05428976_11359 [Clostridium sp. USBA 49]